MRIKIIDNMASVPKLQEATHHINNIAQVDLTEAMYIARAYSLVFMALIGERADDEKDLELGLSLAMKPLVAYAKLTFNQRKEHNPATK